MEKYFKFDSWYYKCLKCKYRYYRKKDEEEIFCKLNKCNFKEVKKIKRG